MSHSLRAVDIPAYFAMTFLRPRLSPVLTRRGVLHENHIQSFAHRVIRGIVIRWVMGYTLLASGLDAYGMTRIFKSGSQDVPLIEYAEILRLGEGTNGDSILFGSISAIAVDGAGHIFVGERQDPKVYVYSDEGKHLTTIGRRGGAPGEFSAITGVYAGPADSLYVFDGWDRERLTVYKPQSHQLAYTVPIQRSEWGTAAELLGVTSESLVFRYYRSTDVGTENERRFADVSLVDWNGAIVSDRLLTVEQEEIFMVVMPRGVRALANPFGRASTVRLSANHTLYSGWNDAIEIAVRSLDGTILHQIIYPQPPLSVTRTDRREALARGSDEMRDRLAAGDLHNTWPVYETFVVDDRGAVWLRLVEQDEEERASWLIVDVNGEATGEAVLPATFDISVVRSGRFYGSGLNESGAPIVVGYEILD